MAAGGDQLFPCGVCDSAVANDDKAVFCDGCELWQHIRCVGMDQCSYEVLQSESDDIPRYCPACQFLCNDHPKLSFHVDSY